MIDASTFRLDGRLALVTGSPRRHRPGAGARAGRAGATVVLNGRDAAKLRRPRRALRGEALAVHARGLRRHRRTGGGRAVARIEAEIGAIDILVNNAGMQRRAPLAGVRRWPTGTS